MDDVFHFMFHGQQEKILQEVKIGDFALKVKAIDDYQGSFQSGQYVWPAAYSLAHYLIDSWSSITIKKNVILELGAGVGIAGLIISRLDNVEKVILSDYDPGSLELLQDNIDINSNTTENENDDNMAEISVEYLKWGEDSKSIGICDIIIGSDLIYCHTVVNPLLNTVSKLPYY